MKEYPLASESLDFTSREERRVDAYSRAISRPLDVVRKLRPEQRYRVRGVVL